MKVVIDEIENAGKGIIVILCDNDDGCGLDISGNASMEMMTYAIQSMIDYVNAKMKQETSTNIN